VAEESLADAFDRLGVRPLPSVEERVLPEILRRFATTTWVDHAREPTDGP